MFQIPSSQQHFLLHQAAVLWGGWFWVGASQMSAIKQALWGTGNLSPRHGFRVLLWNLWDGNSRPFKNLHLKLPKTSSGSTLSRAYGRWWSRCTGKALPRHGGVSWHFGMWTHCFHRPCDLHIPLLCTILALLLISLPNSPEGSLHYLCSPKSLSFPSKKSSGGSSSYRKSHQWLMNRSKSSDVCNYWPGFKSVFRVHQKRGVWPAFF